ncbi:MAG: hypothetical protein EBU08_21755, partial [Micrococcales bacterium]|nr:hypothetical protein [Micrococcales bacterium]
ASITPLESGRFDASGNLGINSTSPTSRLDIIGDAKILGVSTFTAANTPAVVIRSGASGSYTALDIGRTGGEFTLGIAAGSGQWATDAVAGDVVIRSNVGKLLFNYLGGNASLAVAGSNVLVGTVSSTGTTSQALQVNSGAYVSGSVGIGTTNPTSRLDVVGDAKVSGVITASSFSGNASSATYATTAGVATALQNARTITLTGDVSGSVSFDGSTNVSIAATIQPDSVGLGTDTTGAYVQSISGTSNQITVTSGTGEGSTPTLSIPSQFTAPQDVTVTRDLQVNRNLNVTGNITIGGTTAFINVQQVQVYDQDLVLGFRTDGSGNDVSNDTTANHGGIAVASTEGNPLVSLYNPGIGESTVSTYKKIMWFKSGSFAGLNTDAWLINYAVGIGSTQFP